MMYPGKSFIPFLNSAKLASLYYLNLMPITLGKNDTVLKEFIEDTTNTKRSKKFRTTLSTLVEPVSQDTISFYTGAGPKEMAVISRHNKKQGYTYTHGSVEAAREFYAYIRRIEINESRYMTPQELMTWNLEQVKQKLSEG